MELFVEKKMDLKSTWAGFYFFSGGRWEEGCGRKAEGEARDFGGLQLPPAP